MSAGFPFIQLRNAGIKTGYADADQLGLCYRVQAATADLMLA